MRGNGEAPLPNLRSLNPGNGRTRIQLKHRHVEFFLFMLHARTLAFKHPGTGKKLTFEAPLPPDFKEALAALK